jgi:hypothetical protein
MDGTQPTVDGAQPKIQLTNNLPCLRGCYATHQESRNRLRWITWLRRGSTTGGSGGGVERRMPCGRRVRGLRGYWRRSEMQGWLYLGRPLQCIRGFSSD